MLKFAFILKFKNYNESFKEKVRDFLRLQKEQQIDNKQNIN